MSDEPSEVTLADLVQALSAQTHAINLLAASNELLANAVTDLLNEMTTEESGEVSELPGLLDA